MSGEIEYLLSILNVYEVKSIVALLLRQDNL